MGAELESIVKFIDDCCCSCCCGCGGCGGGIDRFDGLAERVLREEGVMTGPVESGKDVA